MQRSIVSTNTIRGVFWKFPKLLCHSVYIVDSCIKFNRYKDRVVVCTQLRYYENCSYILWDTDVYVHQGCVRRDILLKSKLLFFISSVISTYSLIILYHQPHFLHKRYTFTWYGSGSGHWSFLHILNMMIPFWCTHNGVPVSKIVMILELTDFRKKVQLTSEPFFTGVPPHPTSSYLK